MDRNFTIWVDGDAFPNSAKEILLRASKRTGTSVVFVANKRLKLPSSSLLRLIVVPQGEEVADHYIAEHMAAGDLVITADIPLAAEILQTGGEALSPRGTLYTVENIGDSLGMRNFADTLRASGIETGGPPPLDKKELQNFANGLDRILTKKKN